MEDILNNLPTVLLGGSAALVMSLVTLYLARKSGLTDIQVAVKQETDTLIEAQEKRIKLLEGQVTELEEERSRLQARIDYLEAEVNRLSTAILNKAVPRRRTRSTG